MNMDLLERTFIKPAGSLFSPQVTFGNVNAILFVQKGKSEINQRVAKFFSLGNEISLLRLHPLI